MLRVIQIIFKIKMIKKNKIILNVIKRMKIGIRLTQHHYQDLYSGNIKI